MQVNRMPPWLRQDMDVQRAVMALCLAPYPHWHTIPELAREIDQGEAAERACRDLVGIGLLECRGVSISAHASRRSPQPLGTAVNVAECFGQNVARCRKLADLSQDEAAVRASLHRTEISQIERGLRLARIDTLVKLMGALEADADELLKGIAWQPGDLRIGQFKPDSDATL